MNEKSLNSIKKFIENSGYDFNKLSNYDIDLDELFVGNKKYEEFSKLVLEASKIITRTMEIKDYGVVAKRTITEEVFKIEEQPFLLIIKEINFTDMPVGQNIGPG